MKKTLILWLFLTGFAVLSLPAALILADSGKEKILIEEEILFGNPAEAQGVVLRLPSHWREQLLWDTEYVIGSGKEAESSFVFSSKQVSWNGPKSKVQAGLRFRIKGDFTAFYAPGYTAFDWENDGYSEIIGSVVQQTENGENHTEILRLEDYCSYYPLEFQIEGQSVGYQGDYLEKCNYLSSFFHIRPEEDRVEVTVEKNGQGDILEVGVRYLNSDEDVTIYNAAADGEEGIYFSYCLRYVKTDEYADRGQNSGIFYFPYQTKESGFWEIDLAQVRKLCDFPDTFIPVEMLTDEENQFLFLYAEGKEEYSLFIYSLEEERPELTWQIPVKTNNESEEPSDFGENKDGKNIEEEREDREKEEEESVRMPSLCRMTEEEGGILLTWADNSFVFVTEEGGEYRRWCSGIFPEYREEGDYRENPFPEEQVCSFDGERLILAAYQGWESMNVLLAVYDEQNLLYSGRYVHSADKDIDAGFDSRNRISPQGVRTGKPGSSWLWGSQEGEDTKPLEILWRKD